jgi:tetratricopeptide (TPR) repeat protein
MTKLILIIAAILATTITNAQEISEQQTTAFETSYTAEATKNYDNAIAVLKAPGIYNERSYETNLRLGWLYYEKADNANAQVYYKLACIANANSIEALLGYVYPLVAVQNWAAVFETYQKILTLDPNHSLVNYRIALMYFYKKDYANTEKHVKKVLDHYPFDYDCLVLMAQTKVATGKLSEAKTCYLHAQLYNPTNEDIKKALSKL